MQLRAAHIGLSDNPTEEGVAKVIYDIFFHQYSNALADKAEVQASLAAAEQANIVYARELHSDGGLGWGNPPFSDSALEYRKIQLRDAEKSLKDAKALLDFIRDRLISGYVKSFQNQSVA